MDHGYGWARERLTAEEVQGKRLAWDRAILSAAAWAVFSENIF